MKGLLTEAEAPLKRHIEVLVQVLGGNADLVLHVPVPELRLEHHLKNDLGMDSVQIVSLLYELEEHYSALNEDHLASWSTLADVVVSLRDLP